MSAALPEGRRRVMTAAASIALAVATITGQQQITPPAPPASQDPVAAVYPLPPDVHPDRTVTFRVNALRAANIGVFVDTMAQSDAVRMTRDARGTWTGTLGPLEPDIYSYGFTIDGLVSGVGIVLVPGDAPQAWEPRKVPHGTVHVHWYDSKSIKMARSFYVYTPPDYEKSKTVYPTLYLMHGSGGNESQWTSIGAANVILDNAIADRKAKPMVVVMPFGHPEPSLQAGYVPAYSARDFQAFSDDLLQDIMPIVEKTYRVSGRPEQRAIAGLSMGGNQARLIGLSHLDLFKWVASFSGSFSSPSGPLTAATLERQFAGLFEDSSTTNRELKLLWVGCGSWETGMLEQTKLFLQVLDRHQIKYTSSVIEGGHTWHVWRRNLRDLLPLLFK